MSNFPIQDPDLAHLSELLHRMCVCNTREPVHAMAAEALRDLQRFVGTRPELSKSPEQQH